MHKVLAPYQSGQYVSPKVLGIAFDYLALAYLTYFDLHLSAPHAYSYMELNKKTIHLARLVGASFLAKDLLAFLFSLHLSILG